MTVPKLRPLELVAGQWNGQQAVVVRDHEGLLESPVLLPLPLVFVALLLDGRRTSLDVQVEYARLTGGQILPQYDLERIIDDLDAHHLLETPRLDRRRQEIETAYRAAPHRVPAHAGTAYPDDPVELERALRGWFDADERRPAAAGALGARRGVLAPHIDFRRGGKTYGRAYGWLESIPEGACVIVVGVAHAAPGVPYVLTAKGYATPSRVVEADRQLLDALTARYPHDAFVGEAVHRAEHSIEFQVVFLDYLTRGRPFTILPVLCSGFERWCGRRSPSEIPEIETFIAALRDAIAAEIRPVIVVGGVDLSHVGPRFGDSEAVGPHLASATRSGDLAVLDRVCAGDAEGFWQAVMTEGNRTRICGLSAIYTVLRLLEPVRGHLLHYAQGEDPAGGLVGFAACALDSGGPEGG